MFPIILLLSAGLAAAAPVITSLPMNPDTNGVIHSSLTLSIDPNPNDPSLGYWLTISDPVFGPERYDLGQIFSIYRAAIIGDTVAVFVDNGHLETPGFLIKYNDGLDCDMPVCGLGVPNVTAIPRLADFGSFQKWEANKLFIQYPNPDPNLAPLQQEIVVPYRSVIPEPATSALAGLGLAALLLAQYKRSR